jgi:lysophospholipase L1-like esterase
MRRRSALVAMGATLAGCGGGGGTSDPDMNVALPPPPAPAPAQVAEPAPPQAPATRNIALWGDSLTQDYAPVLQALLPARSVFNGGEDGQISTEIAARQGGVVPLMRLAADQLPAQSAVQIVSQTVRPVTVYSAQQIQGSIAGVPGTLWRRGADNTHWFTRAAPGDAVSTHAAGEPFLVETAGRRSWATVFWYGRNNAGNRDQVLADLAASIAFLEPGTPFLVLSVLNTSQEPRGSAGYAAIMALNEALADAYPHQFRDVRQFLVSQYNPSILQDVIDYDRDLPPSSLRRDIVHLNAPGNLALATRVKQYIETSGW